VKGQEPDAYNDEAISMAPDPVDAGRCYAEGNEYPELKDKEKGVILPHDNGRLVWLSVVGPQGGLQTVLVCWRISKIIRTMEEEQAKRQKQS
jgi:hypothetical protein